jgi:hypothetical protein
VTPPHALFPAGRRQYHRAGTARRSSHALAGPRPVPESPYRVDAAGYASAPARVQGAASAPATPCDPRDGMPRHSPGARTPALGEGRGDCRPEGSSPDPAIAPSLSRRGRFGDPDEDQRRRLAAADPDGARAAPDVTASYPAVTTLRNSRLPDSPENMTVIECSDCKRAAGQVSWCGVGSSCCLNPPLCYVQSASVSARDGYITLDRGVTLSCDSA